MRNELKCVTAAIPALLTRAGQATETIMKLILKAVQLVLAIAVLSVVQAEEVEQLLITNVDVYDGKSDRLSIDTDVLVEGDLIKQVAKDIDAPPGATVIDGQGFTVVPGLIDTHTHLQGIVGLGQMEFIPEQEVSVRMVPFAEDMLMRGFTTVRDLCGNTHGLRRAINGGHVKGPRIVSAGACIGGWSSHSDFATDTSFKGQTHAERIGLSVFADGPDEVRAAIRRELRKGSSFIKLMIGGGLSSSYDPLDVTTFSKEEIEAAVDETRRWGTYATAHVYNDESINLALDAGMRTFEHMHFASEETVKRMKDLGMTVGTQIAIVDGLGSNPNFTTASQIEKAKFMEENGAKVFNLMREIGLPIGFGVDGFGSLAGFQFNSYAIGVRKNFFSSPEILEQIYANNVTLLEMTGERLPYRDGPLGEISAGAYADLLIVQGNPLRDVSILGDYENNLKLVMKDGVVYKNVL